MAALALFYALRDKHRRLQKAACQRVGNTVMLISVGILTPLAYLSVLLLPSLCSGLELSLEEEGGPGKLDCVCCLFPGWLGARTVSLSKQAIIHTILNQIVTSQYLLLWPQ